MELVDVAKAACIDAFFEECDCGVGLADNKAHDAIDEVLRLTVVSAIDRNPDHWNKPVLRQFFLRHARWIARVACKFAQARGSSLMSDEDIFCASDQVIFRSSKVCGLAGPGCEDYVDERGT